MTAMDAGPAALLGAVLGGLLTGGAAVGAQVWASHSQANAAKEAYLQQDRVWHRDQRLEAHHAFLNQVNRLTMAIAAVKQAGPGAPTEKELSDLLANTVDAFNRVEFVVSKSSYDLGAKILAAADKRLENPANFDAVLQEMGEASQNYRESAKAELRA
jgi:hypothetical protein